MGGVSNEEFYGILFNNGHLYLAGEGCNYNQLPNSNTKCQFTELTTHVKDMNCGGWHTTYKTYSNELYAMGFNHDGRCALGHSNKTTKPERVKLPFTSGIKSLENGCFSAVLTDDGKVWVAGRSYARTTEDKFEQVKSLGQYFIVKIVVSVYCVLCLSRDGKVFAFGSVEDQDAWPSSSSVAIHLKQFDNIRVVDIGSAGPQNFTVMVWE
jgi:alpha-tubulin suppressor-like RCC1 family protein